MHYKAYTIIEGEIKTFSREKAVDIQQMSSSFETFSTLDNLVLPSATGESLSGEQTGSLPSSTLTDFNQALLKTFTLASKIGLI